MLNKIRLNRELKTKNIELFRIYSNCYDFEYYVLLVDLRRCSTLNDFPHLIGIENEDDFCRSNLIIGAYITSKHIDEELFEGVYTIVSDLIENKEDCHQDMKLFIDNEIPEYLGFGVNIVKFVNKYLDKLGVNRINDIDLFKFNYLSQD